MVKKDHSMAVHEPGHPWAWPKIYPWRLSTVRVTEDHRHGLQQLKDEFGWSEAESVRRGLDLLFGQHPSICREETRAI